MCECVSVCVWTKVVFPQVLVLVHANLGCYGGMRYAGRSKYCQKVIIASQSTSHCKGGLYRQGCCSKF